MESILPFWLQMVIAISVAVTALAGLWRLVLAPTFKLVGIVTKLIPLMNDLTTQLAGTPDAFKILKEIVAQFRNDSGSSLRDVVDRLDKAATENKVAAEVLKTNAEVNKLLAEQDRAQLAKLMVRSENIFAKVKLGVEASERIEASATTVAIDLDAAHTRAEKLINAVPGEAADAAMKRT